MSNSTTVQTLVDGPQNTVVKFEGVLDTSDLALMTVLDPANYYNDPLTPFTQLRVDALTFSISDPLAVRLLWDASTDVNMFDCVGRLSLPHIGRNYGGLQNNAGAGKTGKVLALSTGYTSGTLEFTIIIYAKKQ